MRSLPLSYAARNLGRAGLRTALGVAGSALVVLLVLMAAAFARGMSVTLAEAGAPNNVILLGVGSEESVERSEVHAKAASVAAASIDGIKQRLGVRYLSPEVHHAAILKLHPEDAEGRLAMLRGVDMTRAFLVHDQVRITAGRAPGKGELLVGKLAAVRMGVPPSALALGAQLTLEGRPWTIVGHFEAPNTPIEAEIWLPLQELQVATRRESSVSCVVLTLGTAELADVELFCDQRLDLELVAMPEREYYKKLHTFYRPLRLMVWVSALLIASAGLLGGLTTMYAAFSGRVRELGALQAIGFSRPALLLTLTQESLLMTGSGALLASAAAMAWIDGYAVRLTMGAVAMSIDASTLLLGLGAGVAVGVLGALVSAWRCLRMPIPLALRAR